MLTEPTPESQAAGPLTWRYDGQQIFSTGASLPTTVEWTEPDFFLTGPEVDPDEYLAFVKVDRAGRRWVMDEVDLAGIDALMQGWTVLSGEPTQSAVDWVLEGWSGDDGIPGIEWNPTAGVVHELGLTSWTLVSCFGSVLDRADHDQYGPLEQIDPTSNTLEAQGVQIPWCEQRCSHGQPARSVRPVNRSSRAPISHGHRVC